jgi:hypothetical protein
MSCPVFYPQFLLSHDAFSEAFSDLSFPSAAERFSMCNSSTYIFFHGYGRNACTFSYTSEPSM